MKKQCLPNKGTCKQKKKDNKMSGWKLLGLLFRIIGIFCIVILIAGEYDISASWKDIIQTQAILGVIACGAFLLDAIFSDIRRLKRVVVPVVIMILAGLYAIFHKIVSIPRCCYMIKEECGTYKKAYKHCQHVIDDEDGYPYDM